MHLPDTGKVRSTVMPWRKGKEAMEGRYGGKGVSELEEEKVERRGLRCPLQYFAL